MKIGATVSYRPFGGNSPAAAPAFLGSNFFMRAKREGSLEEIKKEQDTFEKEIKQAKTAREAGINVPKYKVQRNEGGNVKTIRYQTKGDIADVDTNPIRYKHMNSLFKGLFHLDAAGIFHNDLDPGHVFFGDDGKVEFDCFRYSVNFRKNRTGELMGNNGSIRTPDFMMPSNARLFEEQFLGNYVSKIDGEDKKRAFIKDYLFQRSRYHGQREAMLLERRFSPQSKTVQHEAIQAVVLEKPSFRVVDYELDRIEALRMKREAFTEWDEGGGACGHKVSPERMFNSVLLNLDCIKGLVHLKNQAAYMARFVPESNEKAFFAYEEEIASKLLSDLTGDTKGMGSWTFNDTNNNIFIGNQKDKQFFEELFDEIDPSDTMKTISAIDDIKEYYGGLAGKWNKERNAALMEAYQSC